MTSLSFDISVLELLWTLTRGFHVVLKSDRGVPPDPSPPRSTSAARPVSFSLFYFAAGEDTAADGYRLLLESARFADRHGFEAVWTPERHFHAFGGAYPNPSVTGAALAAITNNVAIRAGSVVLPLHSPIRVAEEWAVVDNISRGRVGISFAAGWQPNDFVLNPSAFATAKEDLPQSIDAVRRLWRGETVALPGHDGNDVEVHTLPRPVQAELPTWLTSAGSPATFERAGKLGVNLLTHLLGQSVEQLAANIALYRAAWREAGHEGEGRVTLMMHTYLDVDADTARETAREPMKGYLSTAVGLLRDVASAFPTFAGRGKDTDDLFKSLSADELDQLLEVAAQRYLGSSGLFGTAADAAAMVETVAAVGVDEVACLIDFGVPTDDVLASLELLLEAKQLVDARRSGAAASMLDVATAGRRSTTDTVAALVERHRVTHLQCTPSLAAMLLADPADAAALGQRRSPPRGRRGAAGRPRRRAACRAARTLHQHVRADRDDDLVARPRDRRDPRQADPDRPADRQHDRLRARSPTAAVSRPACSASCTSAARAWPGVTTSVTTLTAERFVERPGIGTRLRHRRPGPHPPGRLRRVRRARRQPGEDPRSPHRAR